MMLTEGTLKSLFVQSELFERAAGYEGRTRERIVALGEAEELFFRLHPHHYRALQTFRIASQLGRIARGDEVLCRCESRLISLLINITLTALTEGDLRLRDHQGPSDLAFTLWSLAFGTRALINTGVATRRRGFSSGFCVARSATDLLLDSLQWKPLSAETDYTTVRERIRQRLFAGEYASLQGSSAI